MATAIFEVTFALSRSPGRDCPGDSDMGQQLLLLANKLLVSKPNTLSRMPTRNQSVQAIERNTLGHDWLR